MNTTSRPRTSPPAVRWPYLMAAGILALLLVFALAHLLGRKPPALPPPPPWQAGNQYLERVMAGDRAGAAAACASSESAQAVWTVFQPLVARYGAPRGYGSEGAVDDLPVSVRQTSQLYQVTFGTRAVPITLDFLRDRDAAWKVAGAKIAP